jgi:hypothetical protein
MLEGPLTTDADQQRLIINELSAKSKTLKQEIDIICP